MSSLLDTIKAKIVGAFAPKYLASVFRTMLAGAGGFLLASYPDVGSEVVKNWVQANTDLLTVISPLIVAQLLSWNDKLKNQK